MEEVEDFLAPKPFNFEVVSSYNICLKVIAGATLSDKSTAELRIGQYRMVPPPAPPENPGTEILKELSSSNLTNTLHMITLTRNGANLTFNVAPDVGPPPSQFQTLLSAQAKKANMYIVPGNPNIPDGPSTHWVIGADDVRSGITDTRDVILAALNLPADGQKSIYLKFVPTGRYVGNLIFYSNVDNLSFKQLPSALPTLGINVNKSTP